MSRVLTRKIQKLNFSGHVGVCVINPRIWNYGLRACAQAQFIAEMYDVLRFLEKGEKDAADASAILSDVFVIETNGAESSFVEPSI